MTTTQAFFHWIVDGVNRPLVRQTITFDKARILGLQAIDKLASGPLRFGPQYLLLPGLVNAHTHLEFSDLNCAGEAEPKSFAEWVRRVINVRQDRQRPSRDEAIRQGLAESHAAGTALIGEIASSPWPVDVYDSSPVSVIPFLEQLGYRKDQATERLTAVRTRAEELSAQMVEFGLSPHAPYSTGRDLFSGILELAGQQHLPVAMHLAESADEMAFIQTAGGPFRDLLDELKLYEPTSRCLSIDECLNGMAPSLSQMGVDPLQGLIPEAIRGLVIHGNFLTESQIEFVARHPQLTVVYCPRTHQRFGHPEYPLRQLLARQVPVAIGTDSRASNPDLCILSELRTIAQTFRDVPRSALLKMATHQGATALGMGDTFGLIQSGYSSHAVVLEFESEIHDPWEALFEWKVKRLFWLDELT